MEIVKSNIANALTSAAKDHVLGVANDIYDEDLEKYQSEINAENNSNAEIVEEIKSNLNTFLADNNLTYNSLTLIMKSIGAENSNGKFLNDVKNNLNSLGTNYSNLYAVAKTLHDFIESQDLTDTTINRWKELESFLQGITDTETLTGLLEQLKTELESKITEGASNVKDVDGITLVKDDNGIAKVNYTKNKCGHINDNIYNGSNPVQTHLNILDGKLCADNETKVYNANRNITNNSYNLVTERALYKHITELNEIIPDVKVIKITTDGPNQELLDYINNDGDIAKLICIYNHRDIYPYLLTITLVEENNLKTSIFQYNQENTWFNYLNIDRTTGVCNIVIVKITNTQIDSINGSKIVNNSIEGGKLSEDVQRQIGELPTIKTNISNNTTAITDIQNSYKIKDALSPLAVEDGYLSLKYEDYTNSTKISDSSPNSYSPLEIGLYESGEGLFVESYMNVYDGSRDLNSNSSNFVIEKGLNKVVEGINDTLESKADIEDLSNVLAEQVIDPPLKEEIELLTREEIKKDLFIDLWNEACGSYGQYNPETGYFELNGFTDITYEEAVKIYEVGGIKSNSCVKLYYNKKIRTNLPVYIGLQAVGETSINMDCLHLIDNSNIEILNLKSLFSPGLTFKVSTANRLGSDRVLSNAKYLRKVIGQICIVNTMGNYMFGALPLLEEIQIVSIPTEGLNMKDCPLINLESWQFLVASSRPFTGNPSTITVHPDIYAKLTDESNTEWYQVLLDAAEKNMTFATI